MSDPLASIRALIEQLGKMQDDFASGLHGLELRRFQRVSQKWLELSSALASLPLGSPYYPEESLALRILQEQKDLEAHTRAVTDVDRLVQIRDSVLKEHS